MQKYLNHLFYLQKNSIHGKTECKQSYDIKADRAHTELSVPERQAAAGDHCQSNIINLIRSCHVLPHQTC